jgi:hypothetical protein
MVKIYASGELCIVMMHIKIIELVDDGEILVGDIR